VLQGCVGRRALLALGLGLVAANGSATATADASPIPTESVLAPVAYGNAQVEIPAPWPVVGPGESTCQGRPGPAGVVLLGSFGSSAWCPPSSGQMVAAPANVVRLGPLPTGEPPLSSLPESLHNGVSLYMVVLHGPISGTAYLAPSLGVEVMATGADATAIINSIGPSVRAQVLSATAAATTVPATWQHVSFAGLNFSVPRSWAVAATDQAYNCRTLEDNVGLLPPPGVVLNTDTTRMPLPCPFFPPPRGAADGLVVDEDNSTAANQVPAGGTPLVVNGLHFFVDRSAPLAVLVLRVAVPGQAAPVAVRIGLGNAATAGRVLWSISPRQ
jgi:hypothetical protein